MFPPNYFGALYVPGSGSGPYQMQVHATRSDTAAVIPGASASASGNQSAGPAITDGSGNAVLNLSAGSVTLLLTAPGYRNADPVQAVVLPGGTWEATGTGVLGVALTPISPPLPPFDDVGSLT